MEKRAVIYIRVSDPSQIENNSLETQEKECRKAAASQGYDVIRIFREEGRSAKHIYTRLELRNLFDFCSIKKHGISAVFVYKTDRFSRNVEEGLAAISRLAKLDIEVISVVEGYENSAMGRALRVMIMAMDQLDNELKGERVKENMLACFRKGLWVFKCPVGYKRKYHTKEENKGIPPIKDPNLAPIITKMFQNAATGIYSKSQLARIMNLEGFSEHYRVEADHKIVDGILEKTFYHGLMYAQKWDLYSQGKHEPLIDETTWKKAYHYLILKKKNYQYHDEELFPLKGTLKCEICGHPMTTSPSRGNGGVVTYYECRNKGCKKVRINANSAHQQFNDLLSRIQPTNRVITLFQKMVFVEWDKVINKTRKQADIIDDRIYAFKQELKSIRKAKDEGLYSIEQAKEEAEKVSQEITILEVERSEIKFEQYNTEIIKDFTERFLRDLNLLWEKLDLPKKQALLQKIFLNTLFVSEDKKIRTSEISPSFQLIEALGASDGENVTPWGIEPQLSG